MWKIFQPAVVFLLSFIVISFFISAGFTYAQGWSKVANQKIYDSDADSVRIEYSLPQGAENGEYEIQLSVSSKEGYFSDIKRSSSAAPLSVKKYRKGMKLSVSWARDEPGEDFKEIEVSDYLFVINYKLVKKLETIALLNLKNHSNDKVYLDNEIVTGSIVTEGIDSEFLENIQLIGPNGKTIRLANLNFGFAINDLLKAIKSDSGSVDLIVMFENSEKDRKTIHYKKRILSIVSLSGSLRNPYLTLKDTLAPKADFYLYYISSYKVKPLLEYSVNANEKWSAVVTEYSDEQTIKFSLDDTGFKEQDNVIVRISDPSDNTIYGQKVFPVYIYKEPGSFLSSFWTWSGVAVAVGVGIFVLQPPKEEDKPYASPPGRPNN